MAYRKPNDPHEYLAGQPSDIGGDERDASGLIWSIWFSQPHETNLINKRDQLEPEGCLTPRGE